MDKLLAQLDRTNTDLVAGIGALLYTIVALALMEWTSVSLGDYLVQPQISGSFAVVAFGRWHARRQDEVSTDAVPDDEDAEDAGASPGDEEEGERQEAEDTPSDAPQGDDER